MIYLDHSHTRTNNSDFILGDEIGLPSPLDSMLKPESRFLDNVSQEDMQRFLTEMRGLKQLIFRTAVESVERMWDGYVPDKPKKQKEGAAVPVAPVVREQTFETVKAKLDALRSKFLQPLDTVFKSENIDNVCNVVELKELQSLIPRDLAWTTHEHNPKAAETNLLSFSLSGYRLRLIEELSSRVFASEATKCAKPGTKSKGKDHGDGTADYQDVRYDYVAGDKGGREPKFFAVTFVPFQKAGSRFVHFSIDSAFELLVLPEGELDNWKKDHPKEKVEKRHQSKVQNRESEWIRLFFKTRPMDRMHRNKFCVTSFASDGASLLLFQIQFLIPFYSCRSCGALFTCK